MSQLVLQSEESSSESDHDHEDSQPPASSEVSQPPATKDSNTKAASPSFSHDQDNELTESQHETPEQPLDDQQQEDVQPSENVRQGESQQPQEESHQLQVQSQSPQQEESQQVQSPPEVQDSEIEEIKITPTRKSKRTPRRNCKEPGGFEEIGIDDTADEVREKIVSGAFPPSHPLHDLQGSRLLFLDNAKVPFYLQKMESQQVCCLSNRVDRYEEHSLPSFQDFKDGYRRHPAIFEGAVKYMVDEKQTYAWQWLLGHGRLMANPANALNSNFSPICLERGILNITGFVKEGVSVDSIYVYYFLNLISTRGISLLYMFFLNFVYLRLFLFSNVTLF